MLKKWYFCLNFNLVNLLWQSLFKLSCEMLFNVTGHTYCTTLRQLFCVIASSLQSTKLIWVWVILILWVMKATKLAVYESQITRELQMRLMILIHQQVLFLSQSFTRFQIGVTHLISFTIIKVENDDQEQFSLFFLCEPWWHFWGVADVLWGVGRLWG